MEGANEILGGKYMMKKIYIILLTLLSFVFIVACTRDQSEEDSLNNYNALQTAEQYYHPQIFLLPSLPPWTNGAFLHEERLYIVYAEQNEESEEQYLSLRSMEADGTNEEHVRISLETRADFVDILAFEFHEDGFISLISSEVYFQEAAEDSEEHIPENFLQAFTYRRVSPDGYIVESFDIDAFDAQDNFFLTGAHFDLVGNTIFSLLLPENTSGFEDYWHSNLFLLETDLRTPLRPIEGGDLVGDELVRATDGRMVAYSQIELSTSDDFLLFHEVDLEYARVVDGPVSPVKTLSGLFPAPEASEFDWYILSDTTIYAYHETDSTFIQLLNLVDFGIAVDISTLPELLFWDDGRITVITREWNSFHEQTEFTLFLLTPSDEPWLIEREVITLGVIGDTPPPLVAQVARFNRQSLTHQVDIIDYGVDGLDRLRMELVTGDGPDILSLSWGGSDLVASAAEGGFLLDLYPMLEADPILSQEDFFPSVLSVWENSRGELFQIAPEFVILTVLGRAQDFPEAPTPWDWSGFIDFYEDTLEIGIPYPLGETFDRFLALDKIIFSDDSFFSFESGIANFDSEAFLDVLEFTYSIPESHGWDRVAHLVQEGEWDVFANIQNGQQKLAPFQNFHTIEAFRYANVRLDGLAALGFPSANAPTHAVHNATGTALGIRANSAHIDAAWDFLRMGLMPDTLLDDMIFPTRIDLFERMIAVELAREDPTVMFSPTQGEIQLPPLTEADAELLRDLIAHIGRTPLSEHPIQLIIWEEVTPFFAGSRTAADTARIIQNRVQTYLNERA